MGFEMFKGVRTGFFLMPDRSRTKTHLEINGRAYCRQKPFQEGTEFKECSGSPKLKIVDCLRCIKRYVMAALEGETFRTEQSKITPCKCGTIRRSGQRYCLGCHSAHMREWRKTHFLSKEARRKDNVRSLAAYALKTGKIKKKPCETAGCNRIDVVMHHPDYSRPLYVKFHCEPHHLIIEKEIRNGKRTDTTISAF